MDDNVRRFPLRGDNNALIVPTVFDEHPNAGTLAVWFDLDKEPIIFAFMLYDGVSHKDGILTAENDDIDDTRVIHVPNVLFWEFTS